MEAIEWRPERMLEVKLKEPDDFLKVRETLSRVGITLYILKSCLPLMVRIQTSARMMWHEGTQSQLFWVIGD